MKTILIIFPILVIIVLLYWLIKAFSVLKIQHIKKNYARNQYGAIYKIKKTEFSDRYFYIKIFDETLNMWRYAVYSRLGRSASYAKMEYSETAIECFELGHAKEIVDNYSFEEFDEKYVSGVYKRKDKHNQSVTEKNNEAYNKQNKIYQELKKDKRI